MFDEDKLVYTSPQGLEFYTNSITESLTGWCERDNNGKLKPLTGYKVLKCHMPNGEKALVLYNDKGEPVDDDTTMEGMAGKIDFLKLARSFK